MRSPQAAQVIEDELAAIGFPTAKDSAPLATALRVAARVQLASGNAERAQQRAADALAVSERVARDPAKSADVGEALLLLAQAQRLNGESATSDRDRQTRGADPSRRIWRRSFADARSARAGRLLSPYGAVGRRDSVAFLM